MLQNRISDPIDSGPFNDGFTFCHMVGSHHLSHGGVPKFLFKKADIWPFSICAALTTGHLQVAMTLETKNGIERGPGEAVWDDFWWEINSKTSRTDLEGSRPDRADPKIQKNRLGCIGIRRFSVIFGVDVSPCRFHERGILAHPHMVSDLHFVGSRPINFVGSRPITTTGWGTGSGALRLLL